MIGAIQQLPDASPDSDCAKAGMLVVFNQWLQAHHIRKSQKTKELGFGSRIALTRAGIDMRFLSVFGLMAIVALSFAQQPPPPQVDQQQVGDQNAPVDEPGRPVVRISVLSGDASVRRGDSGDWVAAALNAPLMAGDSVSVPAGSAAELQFDNANFVRMAGDTELRISDLENGRIQLQLAKGLVTYRVLRDTNVQSEISTPLIAVHPQRLSSVRVEVAPDNSVRVTVRHGDAEVQTPRGSERVREGGVMAVRGTADDPEFQVSNAAARDQWDDWSDQRDAYLLRAQSPRYVSNDIYGTEDLDANGRWSYDPAYGNVWSPNVPATWAPYRNGQWVWGDSYGWTWVDYDPGVGLRSITEAGITEAALTAGAGSQGNAITIIGGARRS